MDHLRNYQTYLLNYIISLFKAENEQSCCIIFSWQSFLVCKALHRFSTISLCICYHIVWQAYINTDTCQYSFSQRQAPFSTVKPTSDDRPGSSSRDVNSSLSSGVGFGMVNSYVTDNTKSLYNHNSTARKMLALSVSTNHKYVPLIKLYIFTFLTMLLLKCGYV